jgi:hypothetical protein
MAAPSAAQSLDHHLAKQRALALKAQIEERIKMGDAGFRKRWS